VNQKSVIKQNFPAFHYKTILERKIIKTNMQTNEV